MSQRLWRDEAVEFGGADWVPAVFEEDAACGISGRDGAGGSVERVVFACGTEQDRDEEDRLLNCRPRMSFVYNS